MPRYLVETSAPTTAGAAWLASREGRFPEVELERTYVASDPAGARMVGVCRAPSESHVRRWLEALRLVPLSIRRIEVERVPPPAPARRHPIDEEETP